MKIETTRVVSGNEKEFISQALEEGERLDGRSFTQLRRLAVNFGKQSGSCDITLGKTRVISSIKCRTVEPTEFRPKEGFLDFQVSMSPMADVMYASNRKSQENVDSIRRLMNRVLVTSKAVDVESLCLVPGKKVWSIRVDITVIEDDGNIVDTVCIATLASLLHFKRPEVTIRGTEVTIHPESERDPVPLNIQHVPIVISFGIMPNDIIITDPTLQELSIASGVISVAVNTLNQVCVVNKVGGMALQSQFIQQCIQTAARKVDYVVSRITDCIAEDAVMRKKEGLSKFSWAKDRKSVGDMEKASKSEPAPGQTDKKTDTPTDSRRVRSLRYVITLYCNSVI